MMRWQDISFNTGDSDSSGNVPFLWADKFLFFCRDNVKEFSFEEKKFITFKGSLGDGVWGDFLGVNGDNLYYSYVRSVAQGGGNTKIYSLNLSNKTITELADLPYRGSITAYCLLDNKIYVFRYVNSITKYFYVYNIGSNSWGGATNISVYPNVIIGHGQKIFFFSYSGNTKYFYVFNIGDSTLTQLYGLPSNLAIYPSTYVIGDDIFFLGGNNNSTYSVASLFKYSTSGDTWQQLSDCPYSGQFNLAYDQSRLYIVGRSISSGFGNTSFNDNLFFVYMQSPVFAKIYSSDEPEKISVIDASPRSVLKIYKDSSKKAIRLIRNKCDFSSKIKIRIKGVNYYLEKEIS